MGILSLPTVPRDLVTQGLGVRLLSFVINNRSGKVRVNISTGLVHWNCLSNDHSVIPFLVGGLKDVTLYLGPYVVKVLWKIMVLLGFYLQLYLVCLYSELGVSDCLCTPFSIFSRRASVLRIYTLGVDSRVKKRQRT